MPPCCYPRVKRTSVSASASASSRLAAVTSMTTRARGRQLRLPPDRIGPRGPAPVPLGRDRCEPGVRLAHHRLGLAQVEQQQARHAGKPVPLVTGVRAAMDTEPSITGAERRELGRDKAVEELGTQGADLVDRQAHPARQQVVGKVGDGGPAIPGEPLVEEGELQRAHLRGQPHYRLGLLQQRGVEGLLVPDKRRHVERTLQVGQAHDRPGARPLPHLVGHVEYTGERLRVEGWHGQPVRLGRRVHPRQREGVVIRGPVHGAPERLGEELRTGEQVAGTARCRRPATPRARDANIVATDPVHAGGSRVGIRQGPGSCSAGGAYRTRKRRDGPVPSRNRVHRSMRAATAAEGPAMVRP